MADSCNQEKTINAFFLGNRYGLHKKNAAVQMEGFDELPFFSLHEITKATDNFSINNKIGEGGFGPVYIVSQLIIYLCPFC